MKAKLIFVPILTMSIWSKDTRAEQVELAWNTLYNLSLEELIQIKVKSYKESLAKALAIKHETVIIQDSIVSEDIADFPDLNIADSLQRISGVTITREGGEGRHISLRGLGPDFTRVQINGVEVLSRTSSPLDSRGNIFRTRAFDFNVFASELFSRADVKKTFSADQEEGGISGTVSLHTAKPFDYEGLTGAFISNIGKNTQTESKDPRFAFLISNRWNNLGALFSVVYSQRDINEQGFSNTRWRQRTRDATQYSDDLPDDVKDGLENGEFWFARSNRYSVWESEQERIGLTGSLQFQPQETLLFDFNILYGELNHDRFEHHIGTNGSSSTALGFVEDLEYINNNGDKEVVYLETSDIRIRTETREDIADTTFQQYMLSNHWQANNKLKLKSLLAYSKSKFDQPKRDNVYLRRDNAQYSSDYRQDRFYVESTFDFDTTAAEEWLIHDMDFRENYLTSEFKNVKLDLDYALSNDYLIQGGVHYKKFRDDGVRLRDQNFISRRETPRNAPTGNTDVLQPNFFTVFRNHDELNWGAVNLSEVHDYYGLKDWKVSRDIDQFRPGDNFTIEESTVSSYAQLAFDVQLLQLPIRGNVGLRYYETHIRSSGFTDIQAEIDPGVFERQIVDLAIENDYSGVLPTFNAVLDVLPNTSLRLGFSRNITRPPIRDLKVSGGVNNNVNSPSGALRVSSGDPTLKPFESTNYDASIKWRFAPTGNLEFSLFYKNIENFVAEQTDTVPYGSTGFPLILLGEGQTAETPYEFVRPVNLDNTEIKGIELSFTQSFDFLPSPFNKLGVVANHTYADGKTLYRNVQGSGENQEKSFPGLSETSYNFTLYYEDTKWGARVALANRSDYIQVVEGGLGDEDERGFHETNHIDFSSYYHITDNLKITFEGINLTNEREEQYSDSNDRPYTTTTYGTTFMLGASIKF